MSKGSGAVGATVIRGKGAMSTTTWKTKWGARRVRREPPTIDEALIAAEAMAPDPEARAEIAAQLMGMPIDEVRVLIQRQQAQTRGRSTLVNGRSRLARWRVRCPGRWDDAEIGATQVTPRRIAVLS